MSRTPEQQKSLNDAIILGVTNGDGEMLRLGLEKGGSPDLFITEACRHNALGRQREDLLRLALTKGADANLLLFGAITEKSLAVAKIAVEQGAADVNGSRVPPGKTDACPVAEWA